MEHKTENNLDADEALKSELSLELKNGDYTFEDYELEVDHIQVATKLAMAVSLGMNYKQYKEYVAKG